MSKGFASNYRIILLATAVIGCFGGLGVRLVFLHVIDRDALVEVVARARRQIIPETARRGDILDARGNVLATSRSVIVLGVDPQSLRPEDEKKWPELAALISMPLPELTRIFRTKTRPMPRPGEKEVPSESTVAASDIKSYAQPLLSSGVKISEIREAATPTTDDSDTQVDEAADVNG